jgi:hypothetical protein
MKRASLVLAIAALVLPASALGKGPSEAVVSGPGSGDGGGGGITFTGCCAPDTATMQLAEQAGFFPAVFAEQPDPMLRTRPQGKLGPKHKITYTVPGPNNESWKIEQDVYPYAKPAPVTYMEPGQTVFRIPGGTRGGWFQADSRLKTTLVAAGLPRSAAADFSDAEPFPTNLLALVAAGLVVVSATVLILRRRTRLRAARMAGSPT